MVMGKPVWAVVCGKIRERFEFNMTIAKLCDLRLQGLLDGILISTWSGQLDNRPLLKNALRELDIHILELDESEITSEKNVNMSFWVQQYQLRQGIIHIPNDVFVLKCRTEFGIDKIKPFEKILKGEMDLTVGEAGCFPVPLRYRYGVMRLSISGPFWMVDGGYIGYKDDILRMLPGANTHYKYGLDEDLWADFAPWFNPFLAEYPYFEELQNISRRKFIFDACAGALISYAKRTTDEDFYLPKPVITFFAIYFLILYTCFHKTENYLYTGDNKELKKQSVSVRQLFFEDMGIGLYSTNNKSCIGNYNVLYAVINGDCKDDNLYRSLYSEIKRLQNKDELINTHITYDDYIALYEFFRNELEMDPTQWLIWKVGNFTKHEERDFKGALKILYQDVPMNEKDWDLLYETADIVMEKQRQYRIFSTIRQYIDKTEGLPSTIYEDILGSALRLFAASDVKKCGKGLRQGMYNSNVPWLSARLQFFLSRTQKVLTSGNYLSGIYHYCFYEVEKNNNSLYAQKLYDEINKKYHVGPEFLHNDDYADALFPQIREAVRIHHSEYLIDPAIKGMIDFLIDEFPEDGFDQEVRNNLIPYIVRRRMITPFALGESDPIHKVLKAAEASYDRIEKSIYASELLKCLYILNDPGIVDIRNYIQENKGVLPNTVIWNIYFGESDGTSGVHKEDYEAISDRDYVTLMQMIVDQGSLEDNQDRLVDLARENNLKELVLAYYLNRNFYNYFPFLRIKGKNKIWLNIPSIVKEAEDCDLIRVRDNEGCYWPYGMDFPSESFFAASMDITDNELCASFEFATENSYKKDQLINELLNEGFNIAEREKREICLIKNVYEYTDFEQLQEVVEKSRTMLMEAEQRTRNAIKRFKNKRS